MSRREGRVILPQGAMDARVLCSTGFLFCRSPDNVGPAQWLRPPRYGAKVFTMATSASFAYGLATNGMARNSCKSVRWTVVRRHERQWDSPLLQPSGNPEGALAAQIYVQQRAIQH